MLRQSNPCWFLVAMCATACNTTCDVTPSAPRTVQTSKGSFTLPSPALADGRELEGRKVNVWNAPERTRVNCQVPDGEPMVLERARHHAEEKRYYFELTAMNGCKGWLPEAFVRPDPEVRK
jgi:hypothetical protein